MAEVQIKFEWEEVLRRLFEVNPQAADQYQQILKDIRLEALEEELAKSKNGVQVEGY